MRVIRALHSDGEFKSDSEGAARSVLTIGNFDGVHLGHQAIIRQLNQQAKRLDALSTVMIFEPQPLEFFSGREAPARLMPLRTKLEWFRHLGVDQVVVLRFDRGVNEWTPQQFVERIVNSLNVRHWVVGDDFRFGVDRSGDYRYLLGASEHFGFSVENSASYTMQGRRVSSTWVRRCLTLSKFDEAENLLGHPYVMSGRVMHGDKIGRTLGAPTANIGGGFFQLPIQGVFAVDVYGVEDRSVAGVAHIGYRPTVDGVEPRIEVHVLDYSGDLYGKRIGIRPRSRLRKEQKFVDLNALRQQIQVDIRDANRFFQLC